MVSLRLTALILQATGAEQLQKGKKTDTPFEVHIPAPDPTGQILIEGKGAGHYIMALITA